MSFKEIKPEELQKNPFQMIGKETAFRNSRKRRKSKHHDCFLGRCRCDVGQKRGLLS